MVKPTLVLQIISTIFSKLNEIIQGAIGSRSRGDSKNSKTYGTALRTNKNMVYDRRSSSACTTRKNAKRDGIHRRQTRPGGRLHHVVLLQ